MNPRDSYSRRSTYSDYIPDQFDVPLRKPSRYADVLKTRPAPDYAIAFDSLTLKKERISRQETSSFLPVKIKLAALSLASGASVTIGVFSLLLGVILFREGAISGAATLLIFSLSAIIFSVSLAALRKAVQIRPDKHHGI